MDNKRKREQILNPTMRENRRYLLLETSTTKEDIEKAILDYIGILGYSRASPVFMPGNILAVNREVLNEVRAALALSEKKIVVKKVSGTIKGLGL